MNDFAALTLSQVCENLKTPKNTLVLFHTRPDADAIGSAFALKLILEAMGSEVQCICEHEVPQRLAFLTEDLQRSVTLKSLDREFEFERCITVDTASPSQLGALFEGFEDKLDFMIDHHANGTPYADYFIRADYAASGEIVFEIASELVKMGALDAIPDRAYSLMYAAISSDTGCFKYSNVTEHTHICAAELLKRGVDASEINYRLFDCKSEKLLAAEAAGFQNIKFYNDGKIAAVIFPYDLKQKLGLLDEHLETLVDVARSVEGVKVAFAVRQYSEEKIFRISIRSSCNVDVAAVAAVFGGGGHVRAAGCTIEADSALFAADLLAAEIMKKLT